MTLREDGKRSEPEDRPSATGEAGRASQPGPPLWEGEARFRLLLGELQVGVLLQSPSAEILSSNPRALELLGLSEDQLLGRTSFHPDWNVIHEDGSPYPGPTHPVPLAIATRQPVRDAVLGVYRPATGDRVWLAVNALPELAEDGSLRLVLCTFSDVTGRKLEAQRLQRSEDLLRITQRLARLGGWEWDLPARSLTWTEEFYRIHDLEPGEGPTDVAARLDLSLRCYPAEHRAQVSAAIRRCAEEGEPYDLEFPFTTPRGRQLWVRTVGAATRAEGRVVKVSGHLIDITEQVRRSEAAHRLEAQLHQVQKMESLGLLAGGIAHDINNVLGSILAVATIHRRKSEEGSALRQGMETITKACLRGGALVESLRGFSRKDLREEGLLDLNSLIREEVVLVQRTAPPSIHILEELSDNLTMMKGDPAALSHAVKSLCANAIQAMPEGGTLCIRTRNDGTLAVLLEIEDSGIGMSQEVLHQAMAPFYTTRQTSVGSGLGLAIVYGTVRAHRGTIDLQSEPGRGTLVRLRFPLSGPGPGEPDHPGAAGGPEGRHILLVDDDPLVLEAMPGLFEGLGHRTTTAASGEAALALVDRGCRPDLVILDVQMPGIGGLETLVQLRRRDPTLPVLLTTGYSAEPVWEVARQHPGVQLLAKPYTAEELRLRLEALGPRAPAGERGAFHPGGTEGR